MKKIISLENVSFSYTKGTKTLENINLEIHQNDFLAIIGPNGGGKTTLLKVILGLLKPDGGKISYPGLSNKNKNIGYIPQYSVFDKNFPINVTDLVMMGRLSSKKIFKFYNKEDREIAAHYLEMMKLSHLAKNPINALSGGQLQRVLIARALAGKPEIIMMDEPAASIDKQSEIQLSEIIQELNKSIPVVIVTHDITAIAPYVKQIACVNKTLHFHSDGKITQDSLHEMYNCPVKLIAHGLPKDIPHRILGNHEQTER